MEFFSVMPPLLKTFWFIAIPVSVVFVIQTIMTFTVGDTADGTAADFDSDLNGGDTPFQLFSLRNLINFLLGFSWCGISFYNIIPNAAALIGLSFAVGVSFILLFFVVIKQVRRLAENNSFRLTDALNKTAEVYLAIPGRKEGKGKVLVSVRGSVHELGAITNNDKIETGAIVKVTGIEHNDILVVEKI